MRGKLNMREIQVKCVKKKMAIAFMSMAVLFCCCLFFKLDVFAEEPTIINGITYAYDSNSKLYVVTKADNDITSADIQSSIGGVTVSRIYGQAFAGTSIKSVKIPGTIKSIGSYAFSECEDLQTVEIQEGVQLIGSSAFQKCTSLESVTIPGSVSVIEDSTFAGCEKLGSVIISSGITTIKSDAFSLCTNLNSLNIPNSVTKIEDGIAYGCISLKSIQVASDNTVYSSQNGVVYNKNKTALVLYPCGNESVLFAIPSGIKVINNCAFMSASHLSKITFPEGLQKIADGAFLGCNNLNNVQVPSTVTSLGKYAFANCSALTKIIIPESVTYLGEDIFINASKTVIYCEKNSKAHEYAVENVLAYKLVELAQSDTPSTVKVAAIKLSETSKAIDLKSSYNIKQTILPSNATNKIVSYKSSNSKIASVNANGYVTGKKVGKAIITISAKDGSGVTAKINITVRPSTATKFKIWKISNSAVKLTWKKVSASNGYEIYRSVKSKSGYKKIGSIKTALKVSFKNKNIKKGVTYYYKIRSYKVVKGVKIYSKYSSVKKIKM